MTGVLTRLYRIARAHIPRPADSLRETVEETLSRWEERIRQREAMKGGRWREDETAGGEDAHEGDSGKHRSQGEAGGKSGAGNRYDAVAADLAVFGLTPPSSLAEVKKARNREIKKYHPDRFQNDPERQRTAKEIMQTYNAAYDRLRAHYEGRG